MQFPDDENGDVLRRMQEQGDDLTLPRDIDFTVVFPDQQSAGIFVSHLSALGHAATTELTETSDNFPWDVVVTKHMIPTQSGITAFEIFLEAAASMHGGHNDGWGSISMP